MPDQPAPADPQPSSLPDRAEVVVVGAGPGGATLAYLLARSGVRTVLLERHTRLDREFRGYFFQPLALRLFDEMGVLDGVLRLPHERIGSFSFVDHGKELFRLRFQDLPAPYNFGINLPQPPLLQHLIDEASRSPSFTYVPGAAVKELLRDAQGAVIGVKVKAGTTEAEVRSRLVVGADGRFSTLRRLLGAQEAQRPMPFDLVWFDLPVLEGRRFPLQIRIEDDGMLAYIPMGQDRVQFGWIVRKGTYAELKKEGIAALRERLVRVDPSLREHLERHLTDFNQTSLLDIKASVVDRWVHDGALLLGDAAHVASPFSGQGNSLALQDAVVAHEHIVRALRAAPQGPLPAAALEAYERARRPAVEEIARLQAFQARLVAVQRPALVRLRRLVVPLLGRTPLFRRMRDTIALGARPVRVAREHFLA